MTGKSEEEEKPSEQPAFLNALKKPLNSVLCPTPPTPFEKPLLGQDLNWDQCTWEHLALEVGDCIQKRLWVKSERPFPATLSPQDLDLLFLWARNEKCPFGQGVMLKSKARWGNASPLLCDMWLPHPFCPAQPHSLATFLSYVLPVPHVISLNKSPIA